MTAEPFLVRVGRFDTLPQTPQVEAKLREQIAHEGVLYPLIVWTNGEIIDGHTRFRIAAELGMPVPDFKVKDCTEDEAHWLAYRLNEDRRAMTKEQRNAHLLWLRSKGYTQQQAADAVGVSPSRASEIESDARTSGSEVLGDDKPKRRQIAPGRAESAELDEQIRKLLTQGLSHPQIAEKIGMGTSGVWWRIKHHNLREPAPDSPPEPTQAERIAELAAAGYDSRQIAGDLGIPQSAAKRIAKDNGVTITADAIKSKTRLVELNAAMDRSVEGVAMSLHAFRFIDFTRLHPERAGEWSRSLEESAKELRTLIRQINQLAKERDQHDAI